LKANFFLRGSLQALPFTSFSHFSLLFTACHFMSFLLTANSCRRFLPRHAVLSCMSHEGFLWNWTCSETNRQIWSFQDFFWPPPPLPSPPSSFFFFLICEGCEIPPKTYNRTTLLFDPLARNPMTTSPFHLFRHWMSSTPTSFVFSREHPPLLDSAVLMEDDGA